MKTFVVSVLIALLFGVAAYGAPAQSYVVIVHPDNPVDTLSLEDLTKIFLKREIRWIDGVVVRPVDRDIASSLRRQFVESLNLSIAVIKNYWQGQIFSGTNVPPPELESDEAVVRYVLSHRGAIGYVLRTSRIGTAKVVKVE